MVTCNDFARMRRDIRGNLQGASGLTQKSSPRSRIAEERDSLRWEPLCPGRGRHSLPLETSTWDLEDWHLLALRRGKGVGAHESQVLLLSELLDRLGHHFTVLTVLASSARSAISAASELATSDLAR